MNDPESPLNGAPDGPLQPHMNSLGPQWTPCMHGSSDSVLGFPMTPCIPKKLTLRAHDPKRSLEATKGLPITMDVHHMHNYAHTCMHMRALCMHSTCKYMRTHMHVCTNTCRCTYEPYACYVTLLSRGLEGPRTGELEGLRIRGPEGPMTRRPKGPRTQGPEGSNLRARGPEGPKARGSEGPQGSCQILGWIC
jgi:hypothetical protein